MTIQFDVLGIGNILMDIIAPVSYDFLKKEGIEKGVFNVGDVMFDALLTFSDIAKFRQKLSGIIPFKNHEYYLE